MLFFVRFDGDWEEGGGEKVQEMRLVKGLVISEEREILEKKKREMIRERENKKVASGEISDWRWMNFFRLGLGVLRVEI